MEKIIYIFLPIFVLLNMVHLAGAENIKEKLTMKYRMDINKDGRMEVIVHDFYGGTAGFGELRIYNSRGKCIFRKEVEGDPYLWHPEKHVPALNPEFFPDLDKDGIVEILVGYRGEDEHISHVDEPWWFDVYKWDGSTYVLANDRFPDFYKEELGGYQAYVKENGECESVKKFIEKAKN